MTKESIESLVEGGKASAAPPLGPALGPLKVNIGQVVAEINKKTDAFKGMKVPVKVIVDTETKTFEIEVGTPPVSQLIKKELKKDKLAKTAWKEDGENADPLAGDLSFDQVVSIAKAKAISYDLKVAVKQVIGTCLSCGVTIDGKKPREVQAEIDEGKYDAQLK